MSKQYTNGRGGFFSNLVKKVQNFINPTTPTAPIKLPANASIKGVATVQTPGGRAFVGPSSSYPTTNTKTPKLSTTKSNTAFTSAMPNQTISIPGPTGVSSQASNPNFNTQFTPTQYTQFSDVLKRITSPLPKVTQQVSKFAPQYAPFIGAATGALGAVKSFAQDNSNRNLNRSISYGIDRAGTYLGLPEFGISEAYADSGPFTSSTNKQKGGIIETSNVNTTSSKNKTNQSKVNKSTVIENEAARKRQLQAEADKLNSQISDVNAQNQSGNGVFNEDELYALDANNQAILDQIAATSSSQEEYDQRVAEQLRQAEEDQFNFLKGTYEKQIPFLETQVNQQIADQNTNLERLTRDSQAAKVEQENTYGDMIKRLVKNANASKVKLGNVFSGLGTVDSSAFQNQLGDIENTQLEGIGDYERDMGKNITGITNRLMDAKKDTESLISQIKTEADIKKQAILNQIGAAAVDKQRAISEINQQLAQAIYEANNMYKQAQINLLNNKSNLLQNEYALGNQYNRDINLQNNEYANMLKLQQAVGNTTIPTGAESAIQAFAAKRISPSPSNPEIQKIMQAYGLSYEDIVNRIYQFS
jgi:hypothetical protein